MPFEASVPPLPANDILPRDTADSLPTTPEERVVLAAAPGDLRDLVDAPCRALEVEYKSWRNLDHVEDQAELVRDLAALANHGGGYVVFGFDEQSLTADDMDASPTCSDPDRIAGIAAAYLEPPVACEVTVAISAAGMRHPVIRVAGHGTIPVCVCRDGPLVGGERLIERGAFYIRKHGPARVGRSFAVPVPQSAKVEGPRDWTALIRRCVRRDRESLLGMIEAAVEGRAATPDTATRLLAWHRAARTAFLSLVPRSQAADSLKDRHYAYSYGFDQIRPEMLEHAQLPQHLRQIVHELQTQFGSAWYMFDPPPQRGVQPRFVTDAATGDVETDFLETAWLRSRPPTDIADFWRVSPCGFASIVRAYAEDGMPAEAALAGQYLSPEILAQEVAELVCHAGAFARLYSGVRHVVFRCEWWGLQGRTVFNPQHRWPHSGPSLSDHCVASVHVPIARLSQEWPEAVASLIAPPLRAVAPDLHLNAAWVRAQVPGWRQAAD